MVGPHEEVGNSKSSARVLVVYHSVEGSTRLLAEAVARGAREAGAEVRLESVDESSLDDLHWAGAIVLGSPVHNASATPEVQAFINRWPFDGSLRDKIGAAFVTAGGLSAGEELVQVALLHSMLIFGMVVVGGEDWRSAFGASALVEEEPLLTKGGPEPIASSFLEKAEALGRRVSELTARLDSFPAPPTETKGAGK